MHGINGVWVQKSNPFRIKASLLNRGRKLLSANLTRVRDITLLLISHVPEIKCLFFMSLYVENGFSSWACRILLGLSYLVQAKPPALREGKCIAIG